MPLARVPHDLQSLPETFNRVWEAVFVNASLLNSSENTCKCGRFGSNHIFLVNILPGKTKQEKDNVL